MSNWNTNNAYEYETDADLIFGGSAVPKRKESQRPGKRIARRTAPIRQREVRVRTAGKISPFAIIGFGAVVVLAALVLYGQITLMQLNEQVSAAADQIVVLQSENAQLEQMYETAFSTENIEQATQNTMSKPTADQYIYVDLSMDDQVTVYQNNSILDKLSNLWDTFLDWID